MARRRVLARRKAREAANDSDADVENTGEQPVDPVNPRGDGRARALERRDRMMQADDALVPTSPKDEETGLTAREKARKRVLERRKLREAQAKNEDGDGEDDDKKPAMDTTGLLGELGKDGDGTKLVRRATILRWADGASVFAMLAFMTCYVGFFWLCLWDNQCIVHGSKDRHQNDPAILEESYAARSLFWVLCVCGFIVVPYVIVATDSARRIRVLRVAGEAAQKRNPQHWYYDRKYLWQAVVLAVDHVLGLNCGSFRTVDEDPPPVQVRFQKLGALRKGGGGKWRLDRARELPLGQLGQVVLQARGGRRGRSERAAGDDLSGPRRLV